MSEKKILHFGLNRSGTNYLKELLTQHFDLVFLNSEESRAHPLHKHFRLYDDKTKIGRPNFYNELTFNSFSEYEESCLNGEKADLYIIVSKDPYSWHLSYTNWGKKHNWPPSPHPYILEYNEFYKKWMAFSNESTRIVFVRYIDLLEKKEEFLLKLQRDFQLELIKEIDSSNTIRKVPMSKRFPHKRKRYYLQAQYLKKFTSAQLEDLNKYIDHDLIHRMGYESVDVI